MGTDLLEQIERELAAITPGEWDYGQHEEDEDWCVYVSIDDTKAQGLFDTDWGTEADAIFAAHAPAHIRALLPVVRASLALEAAGAALLVLDARMEPTQDWEERREAAWDVWAKACRIHEEAVKAFKEGQKHDHN